MNTLNSTFRRCDLGLVGSWLRSAVFNPCFGRLIIAMLAVAEAYGVSRERFVWTVSSHAAIHASRG